MAQKVAARVAGAVAAKGDACNEPLFRFGAGYIWTGG
jgi:hypothetical protein